MASSDMRVYPAPRTNVLQPFSFASEGTVVIFVELAGAMLKIPAKENRGRAFRARSPGTR